MVALQHDRDGAGAFRVDGNDAEAVVDAAPERDEQAVPDDGREDQRVQADPPELGDRVGDEARARPDLVEEAEDDGGVGGEVDEPPRLVADAPPSDAVGGDAGGHEQDEAGGRHQHAGQRGQDHPELVQHAARGALGVAERDQQAVGDDQGQRDRREAAMQAHQLVVAERALDRRQARDQQHDDQHQVRAGQGREAAAERGEAAGLRQIAERLRPHAERERHPETDADQPGDDVGMAPVGRMPGAVVQRRHPAVAAPQRRIAGLVAVRLSPGGTLVGGDSHALSVGEQPERWLGMALRFDEGNGSELPEVSSGDAAGLGHSADGGDRVDGDASAGHL